MFLGDDLSAADCERWGIANRVVPAGELAAAVDDLAGRLATGPTKAIAMTKWLVNRSTESSRHSAFEEEAYAQELVTATADMAEGITAFGERRPRLPRLVDDHRHPGNLRQSSREATARTVARCRRARHPKQTCDETAPNQARTVAGCLKGGRIRWRRRRGARGGSTPGPRRTGSSRR